MGSYAVHEGRNEMGFFPSGGYRLLFLFWLGAVDLFLRVSFRLSTLGVLTCFMSTRCWEESSREEKV